MAGSSGGAGMCELAGADVEASAATPAAPDAAIAHDVRLLIQQQAKVRVGCAITDPLALKHAS